MVACARLGKSALKETADWSPMHELVQPCACGADSLAHTALLTSVPSSFCRAPREPCWRTRTRLLMACHRGC